MQKPTAVRLSDAGHYVSEAHTVRIFPARGPVPVDFSIGFTTFYDFPPVLLPRTLLAILHQAPGAGLPGSTPQLSGQLSQPRSLSLSSRYRIPLRAKPHTAAYPCACRPDRGTSRLAPPRSPRIFPRTPTAAPAVHGSHIAVRLALVEPDAPNRPHDGFTALERPDADIATNRSGAVRTFALYSCCSIRNPAPQAGHPSVARSPTHTGSR